MWVYWQLRQGELEVSGAWVKGTEGSNIWEMVLRRRLSKSLARVSE